MKTRLEIQSTELPTVEKKLSVLIPFLNEGEEVVTTVKEVRRTVGEKVNIIVVNDHSTDGFDYSAQLRPYGVTYILNEENLGSAPSRDICVGHCETPYFLFLDAHMRFYSNDWVEKIVALLEEDDRRIFCTQTKALKKNDDGSLKEIENQIPAFGAYMPLFKGAFFPDIQWRTVEMHPNRKIEDVAFVLGASYAGSVRYWKYLHGMKGLMKYGCEEQYISIKVWLEGGRVQVVKDIIVGHIYREASPYVHRPATFVFNHLWISEMFFSQSLRCKCIAAALSRDKKACDEAFEFLRAKKYELEKERKYYTRIFTNDISNVIKQQKDVHRIMVRAENDYSRLQPSVRKVADYLATHIADTCGIFEGKMGQIIWFEHYYRYSGESKWDDLASRLWVDVEANVECGLMPLGFSKGLLGIGWSIFYLFANGFLEEIPYKVLKVVNEELVHLNLDSIESSDYASYGGLFAYCAASLQFAMIKKRPLPWNEDFRDNLARSAQKVLTVSTDYRIIYDALLCKELLASGMKENALSLSMSDCMDFSVAFSEKETTWNNKLTSPIVSMSLMLMISQECYVQNK